MVGQQTSEREVAGLLGAGHGSGSRGLFFGDQEEGAMKLSNGKWTGIWMLLKLSWIVMVCGMVVVAQGVSTTTVQGMVYLADGTPGSGTITLTWPAFTTANGMAVAAGMLNVPVGADGLVNVNLVPNQGASPAGLFYTAVFHLSDGIVSTEYWTVPSAAQATIGQVRAQVMPATQAVQVASKAYVDAAIQSSGQGGLPASGGSMTGPLYLNGDPVQALQAADKRYVDASFATRCLWRAVSRVDR
jgi:hypothetical protein